MKPLEHFATLATAAIIIAALYFAQDVFVPLALAILLSFALGPLVMFLRRLHAGRVLSVILAVLFAFLIIFAVGGVIGGQLTQLAEKLPQYQTNLTQKIRSVKSFTSGDGIGGRASTMLKDLGDEIEKKSKATEAPAPSPPSSPKTLTNPSPSKALSPQDQKPIPVEIHQPEPTPLRILQNLVGPLLKPLATSGIVVIFVIFFLLWREDLRDRFIRLAGSGDLRRTTEALDDAVSRLSRYLLAQIVTNAIFGVVIGAGLWLIGIPNPVLWGALSMLLRFVPYIGPIIATAFPAALALAVNPGWSLLAWTVGLFLVIELVTGQIAEPLLYGRSAGLSAVAIVVSAAFWTWLWGPIGLLLSTPLTLCLVVLGHHVARLKFLDIVLSDAPALTAEENFYQRLLANDPDEAAHQAELYLRENSLSAYYDQIAIKGLALAQSDDNRGELDDERRAQIKEAVDGLIDNLSDHASLPVVPGKANEDTENPLLPLTPGWDHAAVLCIAGRSPLDQAAAGMLGQLLTQYGIGVRVEPSSAAATGRIDALEDAGLRMICLSYLEADDFASARYVIRRLRRRFNNIPVLLGFWTLNDDEAAIRNVLQETGADEVATSLSRAAEHIYAIATDQPRPAPGVARVAAA